MKAKVVVTLMVPSQVDVIISALVNKGFTVSPHLRDDKTYRTEPGNACVIMGILVQKGIDFDNSVKEIKVCLSKVKHYSSVLISMDGDGWHACLGNFLLPEEEERQARERHADKLM